MAGMAIGIDEPGVGREAQVRRAQPPKHGASVELCDLLTGSVSVPEVGQFCAIVTNITVDVGFCVAHFPIGQQENFCGKPVGPAVHCPARSAAGPIGDLYLFDLGLYVFVKLGKNRAVKIAVYLAVCVVVHVRTVPALGFQAVFHQQPYAVTACVIERGRAALVNHQKFPHSAVKFQLNNASHSLLT